MAEPKASILITDDQPDVREALCLLFKTAGIQPEAVGAPSKALQLLRSKPFDLALIDLNYTRDTTSGSEGLDLLSEIHKLDPDLPVVVMTAWGTVDLAVETMRRGARDFVQKPWENERLLSIVRNQIELRRALKKGHLLEAENLLLRQDAASKLIAQSAVMRPVLEMVERIGPSDANVLITGENGTGKGLLALALHELSGRANKPFISVNMGGLSDGVFESELFGHVRGAFTDAKTDRVGRFELAERGTLFLDEVANIPLAKQAKLLRVLETGEFERVGSSRSARANVRVISATNADLNVEVAQGSFRHDLLFRLNTVEIHIPPLRDRREDIPLLAAHFLSRHAAHYRKSVRGFEAAAMDALIQHSWPGNVRELDHVILRSLLMSQSNEIRRVDLGLRGPSEANRSLDEMSLEEVEAHLIKRALARHGGNARKAAEALGLSRSAFYRRLEKYRL
jgi:DNA-binding NtrC family response regulator